MNHIPVGLLYFFILKPGRRAVNVVSCYRFAVGRNAYASSPSFIPPLLLMDGMKSKLITLGLVFMLGEGIEDSLEDIRPRTPCPRPRPLSPLTGPLSFLLPRLSITMSLLDREYQHQTYIRRAFSCSQVLNESRN